MKPVDNTRICAMTKERLPKAELLRFVVAPRGEIVLDATEKLPGRGIWIKAERAAMTQAVEGRKLFKFAYGAANRLGQGQDTVAAVAERLKDYLGSLLQLAAKSGLLTFGADSMKGGDFALVIDGRDFPLDAARLGALFGREKSGRIGIARSALAEKIRIVANKIKGLETAQ